MEVQCVCVCVQRTIKHTSHADEYNHQVTASRSESHNLKFTHYSLLRSIHTLIGTQHNTLAWHLSTKSQNTRPSPTPPPFTRNTYPWVIWCRDGKSKGAFKCRRTRHMERDRRRSKVRLECIPDTCEGGFPISRANVDLIFIAIFLWRKSLGTMWCLRWVLL